MNCDHHYVTSFTGLECKKCGDFLSECDFNQIIKHGRQWEMNFKKRKNSNQKKAERGELIEKTFSLIKADCTPTLKKLAEKLGVTTKTVKSYLYEHGGFTIENNGNVWETSKIASSNTDMEKKNYRDFLPS